MAHRIPCLKHQPSLAISEVAPKLSQGYGVWLYSCTYSLAHSIREHACLMNIHRCTNTCEGFVSRCIRGHGKIFRTHCGAPTVEPQLPLFLEIRDTNNAIIAWFIYCWHRYFFCSQQRDCYIAQGSMMQQNYIDWRDASLFNNKRIPKGMKLF